MLSKLDGSPAFLFFPCDNLTFTIRNYVERKVFKLPLHPPQVISFLFYSVKFLVRPQSKYDKEALQDLFKDHDMLFFAREFDIQNETCNGGACYLCPKTGEVIGIMGGMKERRFWLFFWFRFMRVLSQPKKAVEKETSFVLAILTQLHCMVWCCNGMEGAGGSQIDDGAFDLIFTFNEVWQLRGPTPEFLFRRNIQSEVCLLASALKYERFSKRNWSEWVWPDKTPLFWVVISLLILMSTIWSRHTASMSFSSESESMRYIASIGLNINRNTQKEEEKDSKKTSGDETN